MKTLQSMLISFAILAAHAAAAHTELTESVPADGAMISVAPQNVMLHFSEPVRLTALSVQRDGGQKSSLGPLPSDTTDSFTVDLPELEHGHYVVAWRALSEDTHVMTGEIAFALGAMGDHAEHMNHAAAGAEGHADHAGHMGSGNAEHAQHMNNADGDDAHSSHAQMPHADHSGHEPPQ